ncbi:hypothetical protein [Cyclonatronum proteinivorum]|nr:hypothetical protein [Cyclonatronum proteinivorum]
MKQKVFQGIALLFTLLIFSQCDTVSPYTAMEPDEAQLREASDFLLWLSPELDAEAIAEQKPEVARMFLQMRERFGLRDARVEQRFRLPWNPRVILVQLNIADLHLYNETGAFPWDDHPELELPQRVQKFNVGIEFFTLSFNRDINPYEMCRSYLAVEGVARCDVSFTGSRHGEFAPVLVQSGPHERLTFWFGAGEGENNTVARVAVQNQVYRFDTRKADYEKLDMLQEQFRLKGRTGSPRAEL